MTAVTELFRRIAIAGDLKRLIIKSGVGTTAGYTIDMQTDATDAKGVVISEITDAYSVGATGTRVDNSWVAATGIVTLASAVAGSATMYHYIEGY